MKDEVTLEQVLELLMEDQPVHVFNEDGDDYFFGYKSAINEEEPVPHLIVTGNLREHRGSEGRQWRDAGHRAAGERVKKKSLGSCSC